MEINLNALEISLKEIESKYRATQKEAKSIMSLIERIF